MTPRVLVAGIGNIFLGDDGFGCEVARRLATEVLPADVRVVDYGIAGMHLAYDLLAGYDTLVIVDAVPGGGQPGDVRVLEVSRADLPPMAPGGLDPHDMGPAGVLASLTALGGTLPPTFVVGCQPAVVEEGLGLSAVVAGSVGLGVAAVHSLLEGELAPVGGAGGRAGAGSPAAAGRES